MWHEGQFLKCIRVLICFLCLGGRKKRKIICCFVDCIIGDCTLPSISCKTPRWQNELFFLPQHFLLLKLLVLSPKEAWGWGDKKPQLYYQHRSFAILCTQEFTCLEKAISLLVGFQTCNEVFLCFRV